jgi:hypothetical protein
VAPRAQRRVLTAARVLVCSVSIVCLGGCAPADPSEAIRVSWTLDPSPPAVGAPIVARLVLRDRDQKPISGARLRLEGFMSHPGMAPVLAAIVDRGEGTYEAALRFTMAGDWILVVSGQLPGGEPLRKQIEIAGVRPAS